MHPRARAAQRAQLQASPASGWPTQQKGRRPRRHAIHRSTPERRRGIRKIRFTRIRAFRWDLPSWTGTARETGRSGPERAARKPPEVAGGTEGPETVAAAGEDEEEEEEDGMGGPGLTKRPEPTEPAPSTMGMMGTTGDRTSEPKDERGGTRVGVASGATSPAGLMGINPPRRKGASPTGSPEAAEETAAANRSRPRDRRSGPGRPGTKKGSLAAARRGGGRRAAGAEAGAGADAAGERREAMETRAEGVAAMMRLRMTKRMRKARGGR